MSWAVDIDRMNGATTKSPASDLDPPYGSGRNRTPDRERGGPTLAAVSRSESHRPGPPPHMKILSPLMPL